MSRLLLQSASILAFSAALASPALAQTAARSTTTATADEVAVEEVVVTGTSIRGVAPTGSALVSVTRDEIVATGAQTTQDIISDIPQLGAFGQLPTPSGDFGQIGIKPSIHNIGAGATLTLLNGHRMVGAGILQTNPDPSVIPPAAVERLEVVADGGSAIYGSDAVAGVVNIILRRNFNGAETSARYGFADKYHTYDLNQVIGRTWGGGSFMIAGEYTKNDSLYGRDRDFVVNDQRRYGGNDLRSTAAIPPNITVAGVTYAYPNFGTTANRYDVTQVGSLVPAMRRGSVLATARQQVTDKAEVYAEAFYSDRRSDSTFDPGGLTPTLTTANPFFVRVPGTTANSEVVNFSTFPLVGALHSISRLKSMGLTFGTDVDFWRDWQAGLQINLGHENDTNDQDVLNATAFNAAAAGTTTATALDPFGGRTSSSVLAGLLGLNASRNIQNLREVTAKVDGTLFSLPGGDVKMAAGFQHRYESLNQTYQTIGVAGSLTSKLNRKITSEYAEILVPLAGGDFSGPGFRRLDISAAIRHDDYSDVGATTNPKVGANWTPFDGLNFHGSYGRSFRAPPLADKNPASIDTRVQPLFASTQFAPPGAPPSNYFYLAGSDPNLTPEKAKTWSLGGDFSPSAIPGLRVGVTWWRVAYSNLIAIAFPPGLYNDSSLRQYFVNNPTDAQIAAFIGNLRVDGLAASDSATKVAYLSGATRMIDLRRKNLGSLDVKGLDFDVSYRHAFGPGQVVLGWNATRMMDWTTKVSPTAPVVDQINANTQIRWRSRTQASYRINGLTASIFHNYIGGYNNAGVAIQPRVGAYQTFDLAVNYQLPGEGLMSGIELSLNVDNMFDDDPPVRLNQGNGYSGVSNPIGRLTSVGIRKKW